MVTRSNSECSSRSDDEDTLSVATSASDKSQPDNRLALPGEGPSSFGSIAVTNSTDVHFGTKTYYQGPVTIKQFLYANQLAEKCAIEDNCIVLDSAAPDIAKHLACGDNPGFVPDVPLSAAAAKNATLQQQPPPKEGRQWFRNFPKQHLFLVFSLAAVLLVSLITLMTVLLTRHAPVIKPTTTPHFGGDSPEQDKGRSPLDYPIDENVTLSLPEQLWIVPRREWLAEPPKEDPAPLQLPVPYVIIMHTATENCTDFASCTFHVRAIQSFHRDSRGWDDIGYSFMVGGDGNAYEGRGWNAVGAQVYGYNAKCIGIAFIGTFNSILPPPRQIDAAQKLIRVGVENGYIADDYMLVAARQLQTTQSPGLELYENIKTWPHWTAAVNNPKVNVTLPAKLKIITRKEWLAQPPSQNIPLLPQPVPYVIISHTATEGCGDQAACTFHVRFLQTFHIESTNYWDIGFNFLIGGDGYAYEGRGWLREGAHTLAYNSKSVGIAFVGTFHKKLPPDRQIIAAKMLIRQGLEGGHIAPDFKLLGVCQLESTSSPGKALFDDLKSWPHWAEEP